MNIQRLKNYAYSFLGEELIGQAATLAEHVQTRVQEIMRGDTLNRGYKTDSKDPNEVFLASRQWFCNPHRSDTLRTLAVLTVLGLATVQYMRRIHFVGGFVATLFIAYNWLAAIQRAQESNSLKRALEIIVGKSLDSLPLAIREEKIHPWWVSMETKVGRLIDAKGQTAAIVFKENKTESGIDKVIYKVFYIGQAYFVAASKTPRYDPS